MPKATISRFLRYITSAVRRSAHNANTPQSPARLDTGIAIVDPIPGSVGPVQPKLYTGSMDATLDCLPEYVGYLNALSEHTKDFDEIRSLSKMAVRGLTKVYDLVKDQKHDDEAILPLVSAMRDTLASLSNSTNIIMLGPVVRITVTRVNECAEFIESYIKHGFWGRNPRLSLSSYTADTIRRLKNAFTELKQIFEGEASVLTLSLVVQTHKAFEDLMQTLNNPGNGLIGIELLETLPRSTGAQYDWGMQCFPGTRQDILAQIYDWLDTKNAGHNVFWLRGVAGSGKTAIASTIAAELDSAFRDLRRLSLGGEFFSKRRDDRVNQPHLVIPTLAFRLASAFSLLKNGILSAIMANPDVSEWSISTQFQRLIVNPVSELPLDLIVAPVVCVIDGLDECGDASTREPLLRCLKDVCHLPSWFKVLVTSRPEPDIAEYLADVSSGLEVDTKSEQSRLDIRTYTYARVKEIRIERCLGGDWPGESKVDQLCARAEGLFLWTALVLDFISEEPSPTEALERVLATGSSHIDELYHKVLLSEDF